MHCFNVKLLNGINKFKCKGKTSMHSNKSPRHYAIAYINAGDDKQKQRLAVAGCPVEWRELVKTHISNMKSLAVR